MSTRIHPTVRRGDPCTVICRCGVARQGWMRKDKDEPTEVCGECHGWSHIEQLFLNQEELQPLATNRLLALLRKVRAQHSAIAHYAGPRCCEICHEYIGDDWEKDVAPLLAPYKKYVDDIKAVLATREHVDKRRGPKRGMAKR